MSWKVVPICEYQRTDVRPDDLLNGGDFRKCETYRGGGGYDQFPAICEKRLGKRAHKQFIVQLYGCNLDCPYCYVTRTGVWGAWKPYESADLMQAFTDSDQEVFHLMGGAPAIYLDDWTQLLCRMPAQAVFHSDFLLTEKLYKETSLRALSVFRNYSLFAVDIKGVTPEDHLKNTRKPLNEKMLYTNLERLLRHDIPFYITFTAPDLNHIDAWKADVSTRFGEKVLEDCFTIPLIEYNATPFVDIRPASPTKSDISV